MGTVDQKLAEHDEAHVKKTGDRLTGNSILADGVVIEPENALGVNLGSIEKPFGDIFIGPNSIYVNGKKVISSTDTTIDVSTDPDQHLAVSTCGLGTTRVASGKEVILYSGDALNIQAKGDVVALGDGKLSFVTTDAGEDISFEAKADLSDINFKTKHHINFIGKSVNFYVESNIKGDKILTENAGDDRYYQRNEVDSLLNTKSDEGHVHDDRYYTEDEVDAKLSALVSGLHWKPSVNTFNDITSTYPNPEDGWTVNVKDDGYHVSLHGQ